jgi:hypothetical protein
MMLVMTGGAKRDLANRKLRRHRRNSGDSRSAETI